MFENIISAGISTPEINACTYPQGPKGPKGTGIKNISQDKNRIIITFDDDSVQELAFPDWWFGTREEYNSLTDEEKNRYYLHFIRDDI